MEQTELVQLTDRQKVAAFNRRYWGELNRLCLRCAKSCKQSALAEVLVCDFKKAE